MTTAAPKSPAEDLLTLLPLPVALIVRGEEVALSKIKLRQLPAALLLAEPILPSFVAIAREEFSTETVLPLLQDRLASREVREALAQMLALCSDKPVEFFRRLKRDELAAAGTALAVLNSAFFDFTERQGTTQKKATVTSPPPAGCGLADVVQLLLRNGHRIESVLEYDLDQLKAYEAAAARAERRARADFIEGVAIAAGVIFSDKPGKTLEKITRDLRNG